MLTSSVLLRIVFFSFLYFYDILRNKIQDKEIHLLSFWRKKQTYKLFWRLNVSRTVSYEITLICPSFRPSVTKVSQDWIISFFWYCTLYLVTDKARSLKKKCGGPSFRPTGLNQVQNEIFRLFFQICIVSFLDISQDCSLGWSLTSSRDETSKKIVAQIRA